MTIEEKQASLWNGSSGQAWVEAQATLEQMFQPIEDLLVQAVAAKPRSRVLDVGCGTGSTTLAVARRLGQQGECVGIDISEPMLGVARSRAEQDSARTSFICADAELYDFADADFDMVISRFGVMFFADPVRAFANLRRAGKDDAELCCVVWRSPADNPFMTTAERAAASLLPNVPAREPDAPGQFGLADANRTRRIVEQAGWLDVDIQPLDIGCAFPKGDLVRYATKLGPLGRALAGVDEGMKARVLKAVLPALEAYVQGDFVRFVAACWQVRARAGG